MTLSKRLKRASSPCAAAFGLQRCLAVKCGPCGAVVAHPKPRNGEHGFDGLMTVRHLPLKLGIDAACINLTCCCCRYGDTEAIEDFLAIGKDVNDADDQGRTALHYAVAYQQQQVRCGRAGSACGYRRSAAQAGRYMVLHCSAEACQIQSRSSAPTGII